MTGALRLWRRPRVIHVAIALSFVPWFVLLGWLSSVSWFITDDAFISFRYVRNLLEGHGLVFNRGEYVEGYTNFLWVLELAAVWGLLGIRPEDAAQWLSVIYTAGTIAMMLWWVARMPALRHRWLTAWMALGLVCSSATFAVWTSGGGLETRQFTFFVLAAVAVLSVYGANRRGLLAASLSLAAAALTRPEGLLLAACCVGWFAAHRVLTARTLDWRGTLTLAGPFAVLIGGHFLARYRYYGDWLPNTYYAKHIGPWYESGFRYLWAAAIETGLYLLIPLTYVALRAGRQDKGTLCTQSASLGAGGGYALVLLCVGTHMAYLLEVGGDHFEYRPLDFYWPLLAVPAAHGITQLGTRIAAGLRMLRWIPARVEVRACVVVVFVPILFYAGSIQGALLFEGAAMLERGGVTQQPNDINEQRHIDLDEQNAGWVLAMPGMSALTTISNDLRLQGQRQLVGERFPVHLKYHYWRLQNWRPYENAMRGVIPADATTLFAGLGVQSYYLPDLRIIDRYGLTDPVVARNPVGLSNNERMMAHDRRPPDGYLQRSGYNFRPYPAAGTVDEALAKANYAIDVGPGLYLPFDVVDHQWVNDRFASQDLHMSNRFSQHNTADNRIFIQGVWYIGEEFIGRFDGRGMDGWSSEGRAVSNHSTNPNQRRRDGPVFGRVGDGFLSTYYPGKVKEEKARALSPTFVARADQYLTLLIAGQGHPDVAVRLLANGETVESWHGQNGNSFEVIVYSLQDLAGLELAVEIFNGASGGEDYLMVDHVMLMRKETADHG